MVSQRCSDDIIIEYGRNFPLHAEKCLYIRDHNTSKIVTLKLNAGQRICEAIAEKQKETLGFVRIMLLKARRFGGSTWFQGRAYSKTSLFPNKNAYIVAHQKKSTNTLFEMAKLMHQLNPHAPQTLSNNEKTLRFDNKDGTGLKSEYSVATADNTASGRSEGAHFFHGSEESFWRDGAVILKSLLQLLPDPPSYSEAVRESTAQGYGNSFQVDCFRAYGEGQYPYYSAKIKDVAPHMPDADILFHFAYKKPGQDWVLVFIPFFIHKRYTKEFEDEEQKKAFEQKISEKVFDEIELQWVESEESKLKRKFGLTLNQLYWREWAIENKCRGSLRTFHEEYPACVTGDTKVSTEEGIVEIKDAGGYQKTESGYIKKWSSQPESELWELKTQQGRVLTGTFDHPVMTDNGWCLLSRLLQGQKIILQPPRFSEVCQNVYWEIIKGAEGHVYINDLWAEFLGFFMGDGSFYKGTVSVVCDEKDQDVIDRVIYLFERLFGRHTKRVIRKVQGRKGATEVRCGIKKATEVLNAMGVLYKNYGGRGSFKRKVHIPKIIFQSPKDKIRLFLSALFECDGSASSNKVSFGSCRDEFVRDVQLLLLGFGINSSIRSNHKQSGNGRKYKFYVLDLTVKASILFHKTIGFISKRKSSLCPETTNIGRPSYNRLIDYVSTVKNTGRRSVTYDFTITPGHAFSANGILTHNTIEEAFLSTGTNVYPKELCDQIEEGCQDPILVGDPVVRSGKTRIRRNANGKLSIWERPEKNGQYFICIDSGGGENERQKKEKTDPDPSCIDVWNHRTGAQAAQWHGHIEYDMIADVAEMVGNLFNRCKACVELMNHGYTVVADLKRTNYPLYEHKIGEPGWLTTKKTKPLMVDDLYRMSRDGGMHIKSQQTVSEMRTFKEENGKYNAETGCHDERVDTAGMASQMFQILPRHLDNNGGAFEFTNLRHRTETKNDGYQEVYA